MIEHLFESQDVNPWMSIFNPLSGNLAACGGGLEEGYARQDLVPRSERRPLFTTVELQRRTSTRRMEGP